MAKPLQQQQQLMDGGPLIAAVVPPYRPSFKDFR